MQPYFLPYIGYFQLINKTDVFVLGDNMQYTRRGFVNRNYILVNNRPSSFCINLRHGSHLSNIRDRYISPDYNRARLMNKIETVYKKAPYFQEVLPLLRQIILFDSDNLFEYIYNSIKRVCEYLGISTKLVISSTLDIDHSLKCQCKVIAINRFLGSHVYYNPVGGMKLYDKYEFSKNGIDLYFLGLDPEFRYAQFRSDFVPNLSIMDVMMFNGMQKCNELLNNYLIINP